MSDFETWWEREGQEFLYALNTTTDDDIKLVAEVAWKNGAYCAEQAEQSQLADASLEPVAWYCCVPGQDPIILFDEPSDERYPPNYKEPLYFAPPPVRTKDLTDDEIAAALKLDLDLVTEVEFRDARAVIAAYKEKNK